MNLIAADPNRYNQETIAALLHCYQPELDAIFHRLSGQIDSSLLQVYRGRMQRHLLPALIAGKGYTVAPEVLQEYGSLFARGYSLPVMLLNNWLDKKAFIDQARLGEVFGLIYAAQCDFAHLPNGAQAALQINSTYRTVTQSVYAEFQQRHQLPSADAVRAFQPVCAEENRYYRSICGYFTSVVSGMLAVCGVEITPSLARLLFLFGALRQMADELGDVGEDLQVGTLTTPVYYALQQEDFRSELQALWAGEIPIERVLQRVQGLGGYTRCFKEARRLYDLCSELKKDLFPEYPFLQDLFVFYDLKLCLLYRLRSHGWVDQFKVY